MPDCDGHAWHTTQPPLPLDRLVRVYRARWGWRVGEPPRRTGARRPRPDAAPPKNGENNGRGRPICGLPLDHRRSKSDCDWTPVEDEGDHTPSTDLNSASPFPQSPVLNTWVSSCSDTSVTLYPPPLLRGDPPAGRWSAPEVDRTPPPVGRSLGGGRCDDRPPPRSVSLP